MDINTALMLNKWPSLDLHGYDRETARVAIDDFIRDSIKQGFEFVIIIHGIGTGIVRQATNETLRKNKDVLEFKSGYFNQGSTIAKLHLE